MNFRLMFPEIFQLSVDDKCLLAHELWSDVQQALPTNIPQDILDELNGRREELLANPSIGLTIEQVKAKFAAKWLAIAAYRCEVGGVPTDSLDIQVRTFDQPTKNHVEDALRNEAAVKYLNDESETVVWPLAEILTIDEYREPRDGEELIGFITGTSEIKDWVKPSS